MGVSRVLTLALGAVSVASGANLVTFDIVFAVTLSHTSSPMGTRVMAIVASGVGSVSVVMLLLLLGRQIRYRSGAHIQDSGHGRHHTYLLAGFGGIFGILSAVSSAVVLGTMANRISEIPKKTLNSSTSTLIAGTFVVWAMALISQALFVVSIVLIQRRDFQQQIQPYRAEAPQDLSEMQEASSPRTESDSKNGSHRQGSSTESKSPSSSSDRSRSGSVNSFRSSINQVVRPITSKTKLINHRQPFRPASTESSHREASVSIEDGFDSWDTSTVDAQSRQALESASPTHTHTPPRLMLETIPASPTTSRSGSPGSPLGLEPPKTRYRSRSHSPTNSYRTPRSQTTSPTESAREAHIHPLFRTDSPSPAPEATPGTIVTAAPGAGTVLSDRSSIKSLSRMRSGSLPASPLMHSNSLDSIRLAVEGEERDEGGSERTLTPPIPEWILGAGPRSSMTGYKSRKKVQAGLDKVGEVRNA